MRTTLVFPEDRLDGGKEIVMVHLVMLVHRDRATVPAFKHAQGNVVGLHVAVFDGKPGAQVLVADQRQNLPQARRAVFGRHRVLHLVEAHGASVGIDVMGVTDPVVEIGHQPQAVEQRSPDRWKVAAVLVEVFDQADEFVAALLLGADRRRGRIGGFVQGDRQRIVGMGDDLHFPVLVVPGIGVHVFEQLLGFRHPLVLAQAIGGAVLQAHAGHQPQRAKGHPSGLEHFRMTLGITIEDRAAGRHQLQADHLGRVRAEGLASAVGRGGDGTGQGLVIHVGHVRQCLADGLERRAHAGHGRAAAELGLQAGCIMSQQAAEKTQRQQGAVSGHQGTEGMPGTHRTNPPFGASHHAHQFIEVLGGQARRRQATLRTGPVAPWNQPRRAHQLGQGALAAQGRKGCDNTGLLQQPAP